MLREVDLSWAIIQTGLLIAPPRQVRSEVALVSYEVDDLRDDKGEYEELGEVIRRTMWAAEHCEAAPGFRLDQSLPIVGILFSVG
jgi:hypothetical protein